MFWLLYMAYCTHIEMLIDYDAQSCSGQESCMAHKYIINGNLSFSLS